MFLKTIRILSKNNKGVRIWQSIIEIQGNSGKALKCRN